MTQAETDRRLLLRVLVKLMGAIALITFAVLLISYVLPERHGVELPAPVRINLNGLAPGNTQKLMWGRRPIIVLHLTPEMRQNLTRSNKALRNPTTVDPQARYQVFYDQGSDLNCPLNFVPATAPEVPVHPWYGGFRDQCRGSWYDPAGRVYAGQHAQRNLQMPLHTINSHNELSIGSSDED